MGISFVAEEVAGIQWINMKKKSFCISLVLLFIELNRLFIFNTVFEIHITYCQMDTTRYTNFS